MTAAGAHLHVIPHWTALNGERTSRIYPPVATEREAYAQVQAALREATAAHGRDIRVSIMDSIKWTTTMVIRPKAKAP